MEGEAEGEAEAEGGREEGGGERRVFSPLTARREWARRFEGWEMYSLSSETAFPARGRGKRGKKAGGKDGQESSFDSLVYF